MVEKRDVRRKAWQSVDTTVKDLKYTVSPLNEGSLYVFRVAAENSLGMSEFCELEDAVLAKDTFSKLSSMKNHQVNLRRATRLCSSVTAFREIKCGSQGAGYLGQQVVDEDKSVLVS